MAMAVHELAHEIHFNCAFEPGRCDGIVDKTGEFLANKYKLTGHAYKGGLPFLEFWAEAVSVWVFEDKYYDLQANLADPETQEILTWVESIVLPTEAKQPQRTDSLPPY